MITNDKEIVELKHHILREVCRLAWEDKLTPDSCERLVLEVIPGPQPQYRCCIYKEREIVPATPAMWWPSFRQPAMTARSRIT